jgi:hypothetical protein
MSILDDFIAAAKAIPLDDVFALCGGVLGRKMTGGEYVGPCPVCGGRDRFSINFDKGLWHCRQCDGGRGGGSFDLVAQKHGFNLKTQVGLVMAAAEILGYPPPDGSEETDEEKAERKKRVADAKARSQEKRETQDKADNAFRAKEIAQARGIFGLAGPGRATEVETYLRRRTAARALPADLWKHLRFKPAHTFWHGKDDRGHMAELYCGPAMIAPLMDMQGEITGCHQTWIDLDHGPKFRPEIIDPDTGEELATKKMRGHKKGSLIPISGAMAAARWLGAEGIENTIVLADAEAWRADTFYFAFADLGNIAGPADPKSRFRHPDDPKKWVAGPVPKEGSDADAIVVPAHVTELILAADGDSEPVMTMSSMARAEARNASDGRVIDVWWPPQGMDFADLAASARDAAE